MDRAKFVNEISNKVSKDNSLVTISYYTLEDALYIRTFISVILGVSFLVISLIILIIVFLMLANNISNYIKENIKTLGLIKAIGYTGKNIKLSFVLQFVIITIARKFNWH